MTDSNRNNTIEYLMSLGFRILEIQDELYSVVEWHPADSRQSHKHVLVGREISRVMETISHKIPLGGPIQDTRDAASAVQLVEDLPMLTVEYHPSTIWRFYVKRKVVV